MPLREQVAAAVSPAQRRELLAAAGSGLITHGPKGIVLRTRRPGVLAKRCDAAVRTLVAQGVLELRPDGTVRPTGGAS